MKNTKELRNKMNEVFTKLESGEITVEKARTMSNVASVMLKSASLELEQSKMTGKNESVDFISSK